MSLEDSQKGGVIRTDAQRLHRALSIITQKRFYSCERNCNLEDRVYGI